MEKELEIPECLPCPFCAWENIRVMEDEIRKKEHPLKGSKYTYCLCAVCGAHGPWACSVDDDIETVARKCIVRWNERGGKKWVGLEITSEKRI